MDMVVLKNVTKFFVTKAFGKVTAVDDVSLNIREGECFSFLGPSGCGKTTTLRMIAGFEDLSSGEIWLGDRPVSIKANNFYVPPEKRQLGMVFQAFAVWPHLNVFENVAFPLRIQRMGWRRSTPRSCQAVSNRGSLLPGQSLPAPKCCCWMNRCPISTPNSARSCASRSRTYRRSWA